MVPVPRSTSRSAATNVPLCGYVWPSLNVNESPARASHVARALGELRFSLGDLRPGLGQDGVQRPGVDLEQHVALVHGRALAVVTPDEIPADLRMDLRVDVAVEGRNPFARRRDALFR